MIVNTKGKTLEQMTEEDLELDLQHLTFHFGDINIRIKALQDDLVEIHNLWKKLAQEEAKRIEVKEKNDVKLPESMETQSTAN